MFSADYTYDDYDNYGTISSEDDVDWWVVEFDQDGWANFRVGDIPAGCDYDILLYDEDCQGTAIDWLEESINPDQTPELIQWEVEAGVYYYVRIAAYRGIPQRIIICSGRSIIRHIPMSGNPKQRYLSRNL